jgi:hypothetical protein
MTETITTETRSGAASERKIDPLLTQLAKDSWKNDTHCYAKHVVPFTGPISSCDYLYRQLPSILDLFDKLWFLKLQSKITWETYRYAYYVIGY